MLEVLAMLCDQSWGQRLEDLTQLRDYFRLDQVFDRLFLFCLGVDIYLELPQQVSFRHPTK